MVRLTSIALIACLTTGCSLLTTGCSLGPQSLSMGFNGGVGGVPANNTNGRIASRPLSPAAKRWKRGTSYRTSALHPSHRAKPAHKALGGATARRNAGKTRLMVEEARRLINAYRKKNGLRPLKLNGRLSVAAMAHSRDLSKWDRISHYGSDGSNPWVRVRRTGFKARLTAENVGTGQVTLAEVMEGWKKSPGHNKNLLLRDATHMGFALVRAPKTGFKTFWTLVLGTPK